KRIEDVGEAHRTVETFDVGPVSGGAVVPRSGDVAWFDRQVEVPGEGEPGGWRVRTPQAATHPAEPEAGKALASSKQPGVGGDAVEDERLRPGLHRQGTDPVAQVGGPPVGAVVATDRCPPARRWPPGLPAGRVLEPDAALSSPRQLSAVRGGDDPRQGTRQAEDDRVESVRTTERNGELTGQMPHTDTVAGHQDHHWA